MAMKIQFHALNRGELWRSIAVGIATGAILAVLNILALQGHLSPMPKPLGLAFAETVFRTHLPLPVGLLFHLVWVTAFSVVYVALWRHDLTFKNAVILAAVLWLVVLVVFFPIVGWGFFGLAVGARLIIPATVSHLVFAVVLWGLCRMAFGRSARPDQSQAPVR
jgi:hypothetical protein